MNYKTLAVIISLLFTVSGKAQENVSAAQMFLTTEKIGTVTIVMAGTGDFTIDWGDGSEIETHTFGEFDRHIWSHYHIFDDYSYRHSYSCSTPRTITITGENITRLICGNNQLTHLDVSRNPMLIYLNCGNRPAGWFVSSNTTLADALRSYNKFVSLDLTKNYALRELNCARTNLTSLDVSNNIELRALDCSGNQLTSLDVSKNTKLRALESSGNQLTNAALNNLFETLPEHESGNATIHVDLNIEAEVLNERIANNKRWRVDIIDQYVFLDEIVITSQCVRNDWRDSCNLITTKKFGFRRNRTYNLEFEFKAGTIVGPRFVKKGKSYIWRGKRFRTYSLDCVIYYFDINGDTTNTIFSFPQEKHWNSEMKKYDFFDYIFENLNYPETASCNGISDRVFVRFAIDFEGNAKDIEILRSPDDLLSQEVLSVIRSAPKLDVDKYVMDIFPTRYPLPKRNYVDSFILPIVFRLN